MLDDLKYIHERDASDALGNAQKQYEQLTHGFEVEQDPVAADNIVFAGMGSSASAALFSQTWLGYKLPFEIVRGYDIPAYVSEDTYFIAGSYSGNTEETISATLQAIDRGARVAVITGGGKLADIAREKHFPLAVIPMTARQAHYAMLYTLKAIVTLLEQAHVLVDGTANEELTRAAAFMELAVQPWLSTVPAHSNRAKQIALDTIGKSAVIYAGPKLAPVAQQWKIDFNENAKHIAWTNQYPEFNHNEFIGWTEQPVDKPYSVIELRSKLEHPRIQKRFTVSERLLSGLRPSPIIVDVLGDTLLEQLVWTVGLGEFTTIYTALASGINPAPADLTETFKKLLEE